MIYRLGPRARRVYSALRDRITGGDLPAGTRLPSHRDLAGKFGVAPMTMRQVLSSLEEQGLVSRQVGRGTFVRQPTTPSVLFIGAATTLGTFLAEYSRQMQYRPLLASGLTGALTLLKSDATIVLALCNLEAPLAQDGVKILRALRSGWPQLLVAALVDDLGQLTDLFDTAAWPLHVLPKPVNLGLLDELFKLAACRSAAG